MNEIFPRAQLFIAHVSPHLKTVKISKLNEILICPDFFPFFHDIFQTLKFHDISMTGKVPIIFQGFPGAVWEPCIQFSGQVLHARCQHKNVHDVGNCATSDWSTRQ